MGAAMSERCQVCGRECDRVRSIFRREGARWVSKYACDSCNDAWLASFGPPQLEAEPPEIDRAQLALFAE